MADIYDAKIMVPEALSVEEREIQIRLEPGNGRLDLELTHLTEDPKENDENVIASLTEDEIDELIELLQWAKTRL